jgi:hypothetical protein
LQQISSLVVASPPTQNWRIPSPLFIITGRRGRLGTHGHGDTVRRFRHRGHDVEIVTHYDVTIDGKPWERHLGVLNDGSVVYHGLPQYAVPSAVDMIRTVIDYQEDTPEDLRAAFRAAQEEG